MKNKAIIFVCLGLLCSGVVWAKPSTIVMVEDEKYFYKNKTMQKFEGQYEYTFLLDLEDNKMVRTRVYDYQTKKITPDETVYQIQSELISHPTKSLRFGTKSFIRAFGQPEPDAVEIIVIRDETVQIIKSTADYVIISSGRRLR